MKVNIKVFGEIEIADDKVITIPAGIVGFPDLKKFALVHNEERAADSGVSWFVSLDEPAFALPVIDPLVVVGNYDPEVNTKVLETLQISDTTDLLVLVTMTIPRDNIEAMSINLCAPIIINPDNRIGCQTILDSDVYKIKYPIYEQLKNVK